jgi:hypothetical protein
VKQFAQVSVNRSQQTVLQGFHSSPTAKGATGLFRWGYTSAFCECEVEPPKHTSDTVNLKRISNGY